MSDQYPEHASSDGAGIHIGIACARFNAELTMALHERVAKALRAAGATAETLWVPGSLELPFAVQRLALSGRCQAVIALGVVVAGDTNHHEHIAQATSYGLQKVALDCRIPVINGIIVTHNREQAEDRTLGRVDKGGHFAQAALEMARLQTETDPS